MKRHRRLVEEYLSQQMTLGESGDGPPCDDCWLLGPNHDPQRHCLRRVVRPPGECSDFDEAVVLPVYTLSQLGFRPATVINDRLLREESNGT